MHVYYLHSRHLPCLGSRHLSCPNMPQTSASSFIAQHQHSASTVSIPGGCGSSLLLARTSGYSHFGMLRLAFHYHFWHAATLSLGLALHESRISGRPLGISQQTWLSRDSRQCVMNVWPGRFIRAGVSEHVSVSAWVRNHQSSCHMDPSNLTTFDDGGAHITRSGRRRSVMNFWTRGPSALATG